jgi:hypothetical protein
MVYCNLLVYGTRRRSRKCLVEPGGGEEKESSRFASPGFPSSETGPRSLTEAHSLPLRSEGKETAMISSMPASSRGACSSLCSSERLDRILGSGISSTGHGGQVINPSAWPQHSFTKFLQISFRENRSNQTAGSGGSSRIQFLPDERKR